MQKVQKDGGRISMIQQKGIVITSQVRSALEGLGYEVSFTGNITKTTNAGSATERLSVGYIARGLVTVFYHPQNGAENKQVEEALKLRDTLDAKGVPYTVNFTPEGLEQVFREWAVTQRVQGHPERASKYESIADRVKCAPTAEPVATTKQ